MTLNESIIKIRVDLQNSKIKKTGYNKFSGFDYFELADFLPKLNEFMLEEKINDIFTIEDGYAILKLVRGEEQNTYKIPFVIFDTPTKMKYIQETGEYKEVKQVQDIQNLGGLNTYYKRYLYLNAFGITDGEVFDSMDNEEIEEKKVSKKVQKSATPQIDYKTRLKEKLEEMSINIPEYVKKHSIGAKTTQKEAYLLLTELENEQKAKMEENNGN